MNRRRLLGIGAVAALAAAAGIVWRTFTRKPPRKHVPKGTRAVVAKSEELLPGGATDFLLGGCPILVLRREDGSLRAFEAVCSHLACTVHWRRDLGAIACPCHAGRYDAEGQPKSGPPKEPLEKLHVEEKDGRVVVSAEDREEKPKFSFG